MRLFWSSALSEAHNVSTKALFIAVGIHSKKLEKSTQVRQFILERGACNCPSRSSIEGTNSLRLLVALRIT